MDIELASLLLIAAPMPNYLAGGATLGPALTFGYVAGKNASNEPER